MSRKRKGMNKHQKAIFKAGEHRLRGDEIDYYLELSQSTDAGDRLEAAENLCPCHVRKPIPAVQDAVQRMMEDPDLRVRRAAWHTLEDGGVPNEEWVFEVYERAIKRGEDDKFIRWVMAECVEPLVKERDQIEFERASLMMNYSAFQKHGKCDFCSNTNVPVKPDYDTEIDTVGEQPRHALVCEQCA